MSYNDKHNEANLEENRDGMNDNHSYNYGVEGETDDYAINEVRDRQQRNMLATLLLAQGVPMICGGDEIGRTQLGNNNAYAQDNEISWFDWKLDDRKRSLLDFTRWLVALRRDHPNLHRRKFFQDRSIGPGTPVMEVDGQSERDIIWIRPDGEEMTSEEWDAGWVRCIGVVLNGRTLNDVNGVGESMKDDSFLLCFNPHEGPIQFYMPALHQGAAWEVWMDTAKPLDGDPWMIPVGEPYELGPRSTALLREVED